MRYILKNDLQMLLYIHREHKDVFQDGHLDFHTPPEGVGGVGGGGGGGAYAPNRLFK